MIRIVKITGPVEFCPDFDKRHPDAKHVRRIELVTPIDLRVYRPMFFNRIVELDTKSDGLSFFCHSHNTWWFVPCLYDHITYDRLPSIKLLGTVGHLQRSFNLDARTAMNAIFFNRGFEYNGFRIYADNINDYLWRNDVRTEESVLQGLRWLLDVMVWTRRIEDGDGAVAWRVVKFLVS